MFVSCVRELLSGISHRDEIGHLFVVDLQFNVERATQEELFYNEIYTLLFEKKGASSS